MKLRRTMAAVLTTVALLTSVPIAAVADEATPPDGTAVINNEMRSGSVTIAEGTSLVTGQPATMVGEFTTSTPVEVRAMIYVPELGRYSHTAPVMSSADGKFQLPLAFRSTKAGTYKWHAVATYPDGQDVVSPEITVERAEGLWVDPLDSVPASVPTGITGRVSHTPGTKVRAQVYLPDKKRWSSTAKVGLDGEGKYYIPLTWRIGSPGTSTWRVEAIYADGTSQTSQQFNFTRTEVGTVNTPAARPQGAAGALTGQLAARQSATVRGEVWDSARNRWSGTPAVRAASDGSFSIPLVWQSNSVGTTKWRVAVRDGSGHVARTSEVSFRRFRKMTVNATSSLLTGEKGRIQGTVSTSGPVSVWGEVWVPGANRWSRTPSVVSNSQGAYSLPLVYQISAPGKTTWRVRVKHLDGTFEYSEPFYVTRTARPNVDRRCLTGRVLCASKTTKLMHWMIDGRIVATVDVRFGTSKYPTREGLFAVNWKSRNHVSSLYGSAMPFSMFFSGGQAVHYSADFARRGQVGGSHGCINVRDWNTLERIYDQVRVGDKVVVYW